MIHSIRRTRTARLTGSVLLTVAGLFAAPAAAQERPRRDGPGRPEQPAPQEQEAVRFNFTNASLETVMRDLSEKLGVVVHIDDDAKAKLKDKKITAVSAGAVSPAKAMEFVNGVLAPLGVTGVRVRDLVKLMTVERARKETFTINVGADPEKIDFSDEVITQIIPLRYATAEELKKEIGDLVSEGGKLLYNARSNALVLTDTATNVRRFVTIVKAIDQQVFGGIAVRSFKLKNAKAEDVSRIVKEVFSPPGTASSGTNNRNNNRGGFGGMMARFMGNRGNENQAKPSPLGEVKVSTEERTNTVIVSCAAEQIDEIAALIADLDKEVVPQPVTRVFPIRNGDATNVAQLLNNIFQQSNNNRNNRNANNNRNNNNNNPFANMFGGQGRNNANGNNRGGGNNRSGGGNNARRRSDRDTGPAAPAGTFGMPSGAGDVFASPAMQDEGGDPDPEPGVEGSVTVQADTDSNSVVVNTDPENIDAIRRLIGELDQVRPQVLVKCFIAEVRLNDDSSLGMEWRWNDDLTIGHDPGTGAAGSNFDLSAPANALGFQYQLLSENIDIFIQGLKRAGKLKVLSAPRVLALDNETAEVNVGRQVPFIRNSRIDDNGSVINTVEYEDIGIILRVTPHVNADGDVRLEVEPEVSEVAPDSESVQISPGVNSPTFLNTSAITTVTVRNNQTVIIGGLIRDRWSKSSSSVPILGDIPLLGELFRTDTFSKERQELMIFLTPVVITKPHDLELLTRQEVLALDLITEAFFERHVLHDGVPSEEKRLRVVRKGSPDLDE